MVRKYPLALVRIPNKTGQTRSLFSVLKNISLHTLISYELNMMPNAFFQNHFHEKLGHLFFHFPLLHVDQFIP